MKYNLKVRRSWLVSSRQPKINHYTRFINETDYTTHSQVTRLSVLVCDLTSACHTSAHLLTTSPPCSQKPKGGEFLDRPFRYRRNPGSLPWPSPTIVTRLQITRQQSWFFCLCVRDLVLPSSPSRHTNYLHTCRKSRQRRRSRGPRVGTPNHATSGPPMDRPTLLFGQKNDLCFLRFIQRIL
jgi:hypothetical protein